MARFRLAHSLLLGILFLGGCRSGIPEDELHTMHDLQNGWKEIVSLAEAKYAKHADRHNALMVAVDDTSNHWRRSVLQQDSTLQTRISRLRRNFDSASRRHLAHIKEMHAFLQDNEVWLMHLESEGMPLRAARGSWDARTTQFGTKFQRVTDSEMQFEVLVPEYEQIARLLPGLAVPSAPVPVAPQ